jgi:sulfoxide reductase heme-binding subunit YedZ
MAARPAPATVAASIPLLARVPPFARVPAALAPATFKRLRALLFALALLPLARLFNLGLTGGLGANPVEFVIRSLGTWALVLLCVTLTITPLRRVTGWAWLARLRRMLGLFCFFYASLHVLAFFGLDQWFAFDAVLKDIAKRPYITIGFASYLLLIPLAATSTNAMVKRLGGRNWQRLHRAVYVIAPLVAAHFWWQRAAKNNIHEPALYALAIGILLGARVLHAWRARQGSTVSRANNSSTVSR